MLKEMTLFKVTCYLNALPSEVEVWQASDLEQLCQSLDRILLPWHASGTWKKGEKEAIYYITKEDSSFCIRIVQTEINAFKLFWLMILRKIHWAQQPINPAMDYMAGFIILGCPVSSWV
jgi:hypothetical protein